MSYIMTKRGSVDNIAPNEFFCDTYEDRDSISPKDITLGSICVVVEGDSGIELFVANSSKEWKQA